MGVSSGSVKLLRPTPTRRKRCCGGSVDSFAQVEGDGGQLFAEDGGERRRVAAGEDVEVAGLEFEDDGAGDAGLFAGGRPDFFGEAEDHGFGLGEGDVLREGVFGGDGFGGPVGDDWRCGRCRERVRRGGGRNGRSGLRVWRGPWLRVAYGFDVQVLEIFSVTLPTPGMRPTGRGEQKGVDFLGLDDEEAVGLAPVGGDLGEEFVGRDSGGGGEVEFFADLLADGAGYAGGGGRPVLFSVTSR